MKNLLTKHYDRLTARERFTALMAAYIRDDETEMHALISSAPRKTFSFPHTRGFTEGFEFLSTWHMMNQLGYAASFYWFMQVTENDKTLETVKIGNVTYSLDDAFGNLCCRVVEGCNAWRTVCEEYGLDPVGMLRNYPFVEMIEMMELIANRALVSYGEVLELPGFEKTLETYRQVIDQQVKGWE